MNKTNKTFKSETYTKTFYELTKEDFTNKVHMRDIKNLNDSIHRMTPIVLLNPVKIVYTVSSDKNIYDLIKLGYKIVEFHLSPTVIVMDKVKEAK